MPKTNAWAIRASEPPPPPPPPPSGDLIVDEITGPDSNLADHPDIIWYADFDSIQASRADMSVHPAYEQLDAPWTPAKLGIYLSTHVRSAYIDAPQYGTKAVRWTSQAYTPDTRVDCGATIMNWKKMVRLGNPANVTQVPAFTMGSVRRTELYARYCFMVESDYWLYGTTEMKLGGMDNGLAHPNHVGAVFWHGRATEVNNFTIDFNTYWYGIPYSHPGNNSSNELPRSGPGTVYIQKDTWHSAEERLKLNTMNPDGTPNADGIREIWFDDVLVLSQTNLILSDYVDNTTTVPYTPLEIAWFHAQLYQGGCDAPLKPTHWRWATIAVAARRIGAPRNLWPQWRKDIG